MILESFVICSEVSSKNKIDYDLLKSINDIVFKDIVEWTKSPTSLRLDLKNFGVWYYKKHKTKLKKDTLKRVINNSYDEKDRMRMEKRIENFDFILSEYDKYSADKYKIKCEKYGKENYESFVLAKKQEKLQKAKED